MFDTFVVPSLAAPLEAPVELPLRILLGLPPYITRDPAAPRFNIASAIARLLGKSGAARARSVMQAHVWAPAWSAQELHAFVSSPFTDRPELFAGSSDEEWRARNFLGMEDRGPADVLAERYDIVHFTGMVEFGETGPQLVTGLDAVPHLAAGALRDALVAVRTRLLILHVSYTAMEPAVHLANTITGGGGPAVVVATARTAAATELYFLDLYANIIHNYPLPLLARPRSPLSTQPLTVQDDPRLGELRVHLSYTGGREGTLQLSARKDVLSQTVRRLRTTLLTAPANLQAVQVAETRAAPYLHQQQIRASRALREAAQHDLATMEQAITSAEQKLSQITWNQETAGAVPLTEAAELVTTLETAVRTIEQLEPNAVDAEVSRAPRVLNANFADRTGEKMLGMKEPLLSETDYILLVDVGPRWDKAASIVKDNAEFPVLSLPAGTNGWVVEVVLISDEFEPRLSSKWMWVPRTGGRSRPLEVPSKTLASGSPTPSSPLVVDISELDDASPGPLKLPIRAPAFPKESVESLRTLHGRLSVYYENNLLQSGLVRVELARDAGVLGIYGNTIDIDYVLTGAIHELDTKLAVRELAFSLGQPPEEHRIGLNVTVNDDGAGGHRVIVKRDSDKPLEGWTRFDPSGMRGTLREARSTLLDCFFERDPNGNVLRDTENNPLPGLDKNNGKIRRQFGYDLAKLAILGNELFNKAFGQVVPESSAAANSADWMAELRRSLANGEVIQVIRTASMPEQYVFPWALVYTHRLPGPSPTDMHFCKIVKEEWSEDGCRSKPPQRSCPYENDNDHRENVLCPYGFWGLKHIVEQPPSVLKKDNGSVVTGETENEISIDGGLDLAIGVTRDAQLDSAAIWQHIEKLRAINGVRFAPPLPADDFASVRTMLRSPQLAYFLCHCVADSGRDAKAYLAVGPRDGDPRHRIYVNTLFDWASAPTAEDGFDRTAWRKRRPLVMINGCHTANLTPGELLNFVSPFTGAGASGVVGTEVSIQLPVAIQVAEILLSWLTRPIAPGSPKRFTLGEAMRQTRWDLANRGNLLGLAYTFYSLASLRLVSTAAAAP